MFGKKRMKEPFVVLMTFSKETLAEIAKNFLKEESVLSKILKKEKAKYEVRDFMYMNFINDDNKIFKVLFQINIKGTNKEIAKLQEFVEEVFECKDAKIENKKDFNFEKLNLKHGLIKNDILIISKDNKQEIRPNFSGDEPIIQAKSVSSQNSYSSNYSFNNVIARNNNETNGYIKNDFKENNSPFGAVSNSAKEKQYEQGSLFKNDDELEQNNLNNDNKGNIFE